MTSTVDGRKNPNCKLLRVAKPGTDCASQGSVPFQVALKLFDRCAINAGGPIVDFDSLVRCLFRQHRLATP